MRPNSTSPGIPRIIEILAVYEGVEVTRLVPQVFRLSHPGLNRRVAELVARRYFHLKFGEALAGFEDGEEPHQLIAVVIPNDADRSRLDWD